MAKVKVDNEKCIGCQICILTCPEPMVIKLDKSRKVVIDATKCKECYLCVQACPKKALAPDEGES